MDNPITTFLSLAVPWATTGYIGIHGPYLPPNLPAGSKPLMPGQAFKDAGAALRYINARRNTSDLFVCMSLQAQAKPALSRHNKRIWKAFRKRALALLLRSFWLDVDIKNGFFRDTQHALEVFGEWRRAIGLPPPTLIVLTGSGGFHAHWILDEAIDAAAWQPLADALANAAASLKPLPGPDGEERRLDIGLTTNPACLLRIPNTFNFKHNPPTLAQLAHVGVTYPFSVIDEALSKHKGIYSPARPAKPATLKASPVFAGMAKPVALAAGLDDRWRPTAEEVADVCPWFARVKHTNGAGCSEPEWFTSLQVAFFCQQGSELAHEISDEHPTYTEEETDRKFALVEESHASGRLGWPQCKTIQLNGASECRLCEHLPKGQSPINFVTMTPAEQPVPIIPRTRKEPIVLQPIGYFQDPETGIVYKTGKEEDSPPEQVTWYPVLNVRTEVKRDGGNGRPVVTFDTQIDSERSRHVVVPYHALSDGRLFSARLAECDMLFEDSNKLRKYLLSFTEQLRSRKMASSDSEPYGWSMVDGKPVAFVYNKRYNCAGPTPITPLSAMIGQDYQPNGNLEVWKENAALIIQQERYDLTTAIAASFGAVLTPFTGVDGIVMHLHSPEGGLGKSHVMRIGQSIWARPVKAAAILGDTANSLNGRLGILHNLPAFFDEVKLDDEMRKIVEIIFTMTQGKTKARMTPTGDLRDVFEFCTLLIVASNNALTDFINEHVKTTTAGLNRIFEIPVQPNRTGTGLIESTVAQRKMGDLKENYGHPGALYSEFLGKNIDAVVSAVGQACDQFNTMVKGTTDERFWIATVAASYIGARIANKIGLVQINERKLLEYLLSNFHRLRDSVGNSHVDITKPESIERYIQHYIADRARMVLITDTVPAKEGRPSGASLISPTQVDYRDGVRVRYATQERLLRISKADFRHWLKTGPHKVGPHEIIGAILKTLPAKTLRVSLANGTGLQGIGREEVIEISNWTHFNTEEAP